MKPRHDIPDHHAMPRKAADRGETPKKPSGTILDRLSLPVMSSEEALRRFHDHHGDAIKSHESELSKLSPAARFVAIGGTFLAIIAIIALVFWVLSLLG